jgi:calnexin
VLLCTLFAAHADKPAGNLFHEAFESPIDGRWIASKAEAYNGAAKLQDGGLVLTEEARRYGISSALTTPWKPGSDLVVQYELTFTEGMLECGGAYLKLLSGEQPDLANMKEADPFTVMFGPDKCGQTNKVHLILKNKNPKTGEIVEHHAKKHGSVKAGGLPHLYTLIVRSDNTFSVFVDQEEEVTGSLTSGDDFDPPFTPPETIPDPEEKKPEDWVDDAKIEDPEASKPDDWDEDAPQKIEDPDASKPDGWNDDAPLKVPDPAASMPEDWSEEDDGPWEAPPVDNPACSVGCGEWKAPLIANPAFKGKWSAPMIDNPAYKGVWAPQQVANPGYFECTDPVASLAPIGAVAVEVWLFKPKGPKFSNILIGTNAEEVVNFGTQTWKVAFEAAKAKEAEQTAKAAEEEKQRRINEGGMSGTIEWITSEAADKPYIALPIVLLVFYALFKMCFGKPKAEPPKTDAKPEEETKAEEEQEEAEVVKDEGAQAEGLRQRKKGEEAQENEKKDTPALGDY